MATMRRYLQVGRDVARDAVTWRPGRFTSEGTYLAVRRLHARTGGVSSDATLSLLSTVHDRRRPAPQVPPDWLPALAGLQRDGVTLAPDVLPPDAVAAVVDFARTAPGVLQDRANDRRAGTFAGRGADTVGVGIVERFLLDNPHVQSIIAHPAVLELARAYFGATPLIQPPQLYWTCGGVAMDDEARSQSARAFHWDYDGLRGLRLHLYLTDVDLDAAPMSYVTGTHRGSALRSAALRRGDLGVSDDEVWRVFPRESLWTVTGPAGTTFVSDSQGLHRGSDSKGRDRLFLVMPIQATGFGGYQLRPRTLQPRDPRLARLIAEERPEYALFRPRT